MRHYSFTAGGFCFHLTQVGESTYQDQSGQEWLKNGNRLISAGGCYNHTIQPEDSMDNKDAFQYLRQLRGDGNRDGYLHDRILYINS